MHFPRGRTPPILLAVLSALLLFSGCGGTAASPSGTTHDRENPQSGASEQSAAPTAGAGGAGSQQRNQTQGSSAATPIAQTVGFTDDPNRKIIKNADLTLEVESVEIGLSRISGIAAQTGGYLLDSRTDFSSTTAKSAVIQIAVPVNKFELALERIREIGPVLSEHASGSDATQEFVDVQSQIANLEATQARIREFLDRAETVEEALRVNTQLTEIEGQISQLKGRLQFLSQRAAYSTITTQLQQLSPQATPTPTPGPVVWDPGGTAGQAYSALKIILQALGTVGIWLAILVLPLVLPAGLIALAIRSRRGRTVRPPLADDAGKIS